MFGDVMTGGKDVRDVKAEGLSAVSSYRRCCPEIGFQGRWSPWLPVFYMQVLVWSRVC